MAGAAGVRIGGAMLREVSIARHCCGMSANIETYRLLVGDELIDEVLSLADDLKGVRICHVNSTAFGGGVAELLARHLPLLQALGLSVDWRLIRGEPEFFTVTKAMHNGLQGADYELDERARALYRDVNERAAGLLETAYDVFVVHDPQPAALRHFAGSRDARWIWRCHIDSSTPNPAVRDFLAQFIADYDALVFTMAEFLPPRLEIKRVVFQRGSDVVIQKSIREGFGLVVSEALWKEKPVVAGRAGGIPMQFPEGFERYLVDSVEACAEHILHLLKQPGARGDLGRAGREHMRRHFLLPRLVRDELRLIKELL
jgi:hypothetical protein